MTARRFVVADPDHFPVLTSPTFERAGTEYTMRWADPPVTMTFSGVREHSEGLYAEIVVEHGGFELHWSRLGLASTVGREAIVKKLTATLDFVPWRLMLDAACRRVAMTARQGEPLVELTGSLEVSADDVLMPGMLYDGNPTMIFADGDTGKSLTAAAIAVAVATGTPLPFGLKPTGAAVVAYLDWETNAETVDGRFRSLAAGLGVAMQPILYKPMTRPLVAEAPTLAAEFSRRGVRLVIADSMMFAVAGGDGGGFHEPITAFYAALRLFAPSTSLVLNHVTNVDARAGGPARPFGGAFAFNGPRLIWEAKRDREITDATAIAFTNAKANNLVPTPAPFGLRFQKQGGATLVAPFDLTEAAPQTVASAAMSYRIRLALASQELTVTELAKLLPAKEATVRRTVSALAKKGSLARVEGASEGGRGKESRWRLGQPWHG